MTEKLKISELARRVGITARKVRFYETLGLILPTERTSSGYRMYAADAVERLRFILAMKELGLTLVQIRDVMVIWDKGESPCGRVSRILDERLEELDLRIASMIQARDDLRAYKAKMDSQASHEGTACRHIQGVLTGEWKSDLPPPPRTPPRRGSSSG